MKRELKFRAWNGKNIILPEYAEQDDFHLLADGTIVETHEHGYERHELTSRRSEDWEVMQYTGLKDKKEVEIYEDDIVKFAVKKRGCKNNDCEESGDLGINSFCPSCGTKVTDDDFITVSKIVFDKGSFAYEYNHTEYSYQSWKTYVAESHIEWVEVIGNIHEHANLLNP